MPTVEVDEVELQRGRDALKMLNKIWNKNAAREHLLRAQKEVDPNDPAVQDLDKPDPRSEEITNLRKEFADYRKSQEDAEAERAKNAVLDRHRAAWDSDIAELRRSGWQDEGIKQLEKIRDEKGLLSAKDCATLFERDHPPAAPIVTTGNSWNFSDPINDADENIKKLIETKGESDAITHRMVGEALSEFRQAHPLGRR